MNRPARIQDCRTYMPFVLLETSVFTMGPGGGRDMISICGLPSPPPTNKFNGGCWIQLTTKGSINVAKGSSNRAGTSLTTALLNNDNSAPNCSYKSRITCALNVAWYSVPAGIFFYLGHPVCVSWEKSLVLSFIHEG